MLGSKESVKIILHSPSIGIAAICCMLHNGHSDSSCTVTFLINSLDSVVHRTVFKNSSICYDKGGSCPCCMVMRVIQRHYWIIFYVADRRRVSTVISHSNTYLKPIRSLFGIHNLFDFFLVLVFDEVIRMYGRCDAMCKCNIRYHML